MSRRTFLGALGAAGTASMSKLAVQVTDVQTASVASQHGALPDLIAHWKLNGDCKDALGKHHGEGHNIKFVEGRDGKPGGAACFNGLDAFISVDDDGDWRFGTKEFSISTWINVKQDMESVAGDILTKFDGTARSGFNFGLGGSSAGYSSVGDAKNIYFGVDDGICGSWLDCGSPWKSNPLISTLAVHKGQLYTGTADASKPEDACHVFRYAADSQWVDCGRVGNDTLTLTAFSLISHKGNLYCGTGVWDWSKAMPGRGGPAHVYCYEGGEHWRDCGRVGHGIRIFSLASFKGDLYAGDDTGNCYRWDGGTTWIFCGQLGHDHRLNSMMVFKGNLYGCSHDGVYRYERDTNWTSVGQHPGGSNQIHKLQVYDSHLYAGTWPYGNVMRYDGESNWIDTGQLGIATDKYQINEVNDLRVYNGKMYAGVLPKAEVYRYEAVGNWTMLRRMVQDANWAGGDNHTWFRVPCMTVFQGKLFHGTSTCHGAADPMSPAEAGRIYAMEAGKMASYDDDLGTGWKHLVAVREQNVLRIYLNGKECAVSSRFNSEDYPQSNRSPLLIGLGATSNFSGSLAEVRIYGGALSADQASNLYGKGA